MKLRLFTVSILLALLLASFAGVGAQGMTKMCIGLSEADCALMTSVGTTPVTSFAQSFTFDLSVTGLTVMDPSASDVSIHAEGNGPFSLDMTKMTPENPLGGVNLGMDMSGSVSAPEAPPAGNVSFMIVDSVLYFKNPNGDGWIGVNLADAMKSAGVDFGSIIGAATSGVNAGAGMGMNMDMSKVDFVTQTRGEDSTIDGHTVANFTTSLDLSKFLASPTFTEALTMASSLGAGAGGSGSNSQDMQQAMMMIPMVAQMVSGNINATVGVGTDDSFAHHFAIVAHIELNLGAMMGAMGGSSDANAPKVSPIVVDLNLNVEMSGVNATAAPVAPEGAKILTADEFQAAMGG